MGFYSSCPALWVLSIILVKLHYFWNIDFLRHRFGWQYGRENYRDYRIYSYHVKHKFLIMDCQCIWSYAFSSLVLVIFNRWGGIPLGLFKMGFFWIVVHMHTISPEVFFRFNEWHSGGGGSIRGWALACYIFCYFGLVEKIVKIEIRISRRSLLKACLIYKVAILN